MKTVVIKIIVFVWFVVACVVTGSAQNESGKFYLAVFGGFSVSQVTDDLKSEMIASGFDDQSVLWGEVDYPIQRENPVFDMEATYFFTENTGIAFNAGMVNKVEVSGYESISYWGNHLQLNSKIWSFSLCYTYRSRNQSHLLTVGPSFFNHQVKANSDIVDRNSVTFKKTGAYLGYSYLLMNKKRFFLAAKANFRWAPASDVGPYEKTITIGQQSLNPETLNSVFEQTKVHLAIFNMGIAIGLKSGA